MCRTAASVSNGAQDGTDSLVTAYQQAVVSANNVIFNGPLGADASISTPSGSQVRPPHCFCPQLSSHLSLPARLFSVLCGDALLSHCTKYCAQETFDLNSFWATAVASDIALTVTASLGGAQQGQFVTTLPLGSYRLPITLPQPGFTVRPLVAPPAWHSAHTHEQTAANGRWLPVRSASFGCRLRHSYDSIYDTSAAGRGHGDVPRVRPEHRLRRGQHVHQRGHHVDSPTSAVTAPGPAAAAQLVAADADARQLAAFFQRAASTAAEPAATSSEPAASASAEPAAPATAVASTTEPTPATKPSAALVAERLRRRVRRNTVQLRQHHHDDPGPQPSGARRQQPSLQRLPRAGT